MSEALSTPMTQAVGWALVHFLWQGTLVALGLAAALSLLRSRSAAMRYTVSAGALALLPALLVATALRSYSDSAPAAPVARAEAAAPEAPASFVLDTSGEIPASAPGLRELLQPYVPSLFSVWLAGVALLSIWHLGGWTQARRLTRVGTRPVEERWEQALLRLRSRLGIDRAVEILESSSVPVPAVVGWLKPVILVPASAFAGLTPQQLEAVLAHELAHVRRHDYLVNLLQAAVETLLFYHPAVWWVSRQVRQERECCCDDLAVAVCGERLDYVRALAALEGLRTPRLALGADGGSLLLRIRRIAGVQEGNSRPVAWMAGALTLALLAAGAIFHEGARASLPLQIQVAGPVLQAPQPPPQPPLSPTGERIGPAAPPAPSALLAQGPAAAPKAPSASAPHGNTGQWTAGRLGDGKIQLTMTYEHPDEGRVFQGTWYRESDFHGLGSGQDVRFELRREAGTFSFIGRFDGTGRGSKGSGSFTFQGSPSYVKEMASLGYKVEAKNLFNLALFDVSRQFVSELRQLGYDDLSLEKLVEFRIHGVSPEFIRGLAEVGLRDLPANRLVEFRIHGVSAELVRALSEAGHENLSPDKLVSLKIHGATPEFAREMAELGYGDVPLDRLVEFRIHGVSPEFVRSLAEAGHEGIAAQDLVSMRIHGVTAQFVREAEKREGRKLSEREIISRKISGRY